MTVVGWVERSDTQQTSTKYWQNLMHLRHIVGYRFTPPNRQAKLIETVHQVKSWPYSPTDYRYMCFLPFCGSFCKVRLVFDADQTALRRNCW